jgi:hypothetical protein
LALPDYGEEALRNLGFSSLRHLTTLLGSVLSQKAHKPQSIGVHGNIIK